MPDSPSYSSDRMVSTLWAVPNLLRQNISFPYFKAVITKHYSLFFLCKLLNQMLYYCYFFICFKVHSNIKLPSYHSQWWNYLSVVESFHGIHEALPQEFTASTVYLFILYITLCIEEHFRPFYTFTACPVLIKTT